MIRAFGVSVIGVIGLLFLMSSSNASEPPVTMTIRLIGTSDVHGEVTGFDYFTGSFVQRGLVHTAVTIREAQSEQPNHLLIDNGDLIQGSPLASWAQQHSRVKHPIIKILNQLEYDVANIGNHEFNFGLEALWQIYSQANFAVLSSNIEALQASHTTVPSWLQKTVLLKRQFRASDGEYYPIHIGFVGVLPPQIMMWDQQYLKGKIRTHDIVSATEKGVKEVLEQGADIVVLVAHTGMPKDTALPSDAEQALHRAAQTSGVDAILFGHQHELFPGTQVYDQLPHVDSEAGTIHGIPAVQPGFYGTHVGVIDLTLLRHGDRWQRHSNHSELRSITAAKAADIQAIVATAHQQTQDYVEQPVGFTQHTLSHRFARLEPTASMQLIHQAQLWHLQQINDVEVRKQIGTLPVISAAAPFVAAMHEDDLNYTLIESGAITLGDIGDLYRYPNTLELVRINGSQLKQWLEGTAKGFQEGQAHAPFSFINRDIPSYNVDSFWGIDYAIDPARPIGDRIINLSFAGTRIQADQALLVATNNYRAAGGGDFAGFDGTQTIYRSPDEIQKILVDYLQQLPKGRYQSKLIKNWRVKGFTID